MDAQQAVTAMTVLEHVSLAIQKKADEIEREISLRGRDHVMTRGELASILLDIAQDIDKRIMQTPGAPVCACPPSSAP